MVKINSILFLIKDVYKKSLISLTVASQSFHVTQNIIWLHNITQINVNG